MSEYITYLQTLLTLYITTKQNIQPEVATSKSMPDLRRRWWSENVK